MNFLGIVRTLRFAALSYAQAGQPNAATLSAQLGQRISIQSCAGEWHAASLCARWKWSSRDPVTRISRRLVRVSFGDASPCKEVHGRSGGPPRSG